MKAKALAAAALCALLMAGCSGGGQKAAITTCTGEMDNNLKTTVVLKAPGENEPLTDMSMKMTASYDDLFGTEMNGVDPKGLVDSMEGMLVTTLSQQFDIPEEDITVTAGDEAIDIDIKISDIPGFLSNVTGQDVDEKDVTFKQAKSELSDNLTCD